MITTCIFDLDGTIVDSLEDLADTTNLLLEKYQYSKHSMHSYRKFVGEGIDRLLQKAFGTEDKAFLQTIRKEFDILYQTKCLDKTKPYLGIIALLTKLQQQGIKMAVVTNKAQEIAEFMVEQIFPTMFLYVYGNSDAYPRKPNPFIVNKVIVELHSNKEECIFIGDSDIDIITGKNAKIKTIGVAWGFRGEAELRHCGADAIANIPEDIRRIIDDWSK